MYEKESSFSGIKFSLEECCTSKLEKTDAVGRLKG